MALAKFKRTNLGTSSVSIQTKTPTIQSDNSKAEMLGIMAQAQKARQVRADREFTNNLKKGYLTGKMSDVQYHTEMANYYSKKMESAPDEASRSSAEIGMLTQMEAAQNASTAAGNRARSAAAKSANAEYTDIKSELAIATNELNNNIKVGKYKSAAEYIDAKKQLYDLTVEAWSNVSQNSNMSESARNTAEDNLIKNANDAENPYGTGQFGGLVEMYNKKDNFAFVQSTEGENRGQIMLGYHPEFKGQDQTTSGNQMFIKGDDGVYRQAFKLLRTDPMTGDRIYTNPETGQQETLTAGMDNEKIKQYENDYGVLVYNPQDREDVRLLFTKPDEAGKFSGKWQGVGGYANIQLDKPGWFNMENATGFEATKTPGMESDALKMSVGPQTDISFMPPKEQNMSYIKEPIDLMRPPVQQQPEVIVPEFKPNFENLKTEQQSVRPSIEPQQNFNIMNEAQKWAGQGFSFFKNKIKNLFGG